eukprot:4308012-Prymnesium_polylepis.2
MTTTHARWLIVTYVQRARVRHQGEREETRLSGVTRAVLDACVAHLVPLHNGAILGERVDERLRPLDVVRLVVVVADGAVVLDRRQQLLGDVLQKAPAAGAAHARCTSKRKRPTCIKVAIAVRVAAPLCDVDALPFRDDRELLCRRGSRWPPLQRSVVRAMHQRKHRLAWQRRHAAEASKARQHPAVKRLVRCQLHLKLLAQRDGFGERRPQGVNL